ncbi:hypothetical protein KY335_01225 [Candidatus Woesearchaeota archaeon]|nr:hypothetical protein [Candidatus Woesearchaeota archaeon]MBW3013846.1 hypothetical protein [Candidatus Woesearchaeota archaeon]
MIVEKAFLDKLKEFGLNSYESKLWIALLSRGVSTAGELADISAVPRSRSYDVLESLEKKGFIKMKTTKPIKYIAVSPGEVLNRVKEKLVQQTSEDIEILESLKASKLVDELNVLFSQGLDALDPTELSGSLKGQENIFHHLSMLIKNAEASIKFVTTGSAFMKELEYFKEDLENAKKRGVDITIAVPHNKQIKDAVRSLKLGKVVDTNLTSRFAIIDNKELMFMLLDDSKVHKSYDIGIWVNSPYFTSYLNGMLEGYAKQ